MNFLAIDFETTGYDFGAANEPWQLGYARVEDGAIVETGEWFFDVGSPHDKVDWRTLLPMLEKDGVEWLVVKPVAHPDSLADLKASIEYLKRAVEY